MAKLSSPQPLLDSLEYISEQSLPNSIELPFAYLDYNAAKDFLLQFDGSKATFESYRRELERLLQWAWRIEKISIISLTRADIEEYLHFCHKPPKSWIGTKRVARFVTSGGIRKINPQWRPFVATLSKSERKEGKKPQASDYKLSNQSISCLFIALGSFYNHLLNEDLVQTNPIAQIRQKSKYMKKQQGQRKIRRLSELQWDFVLETAELMAKENPDLHERTLFIMTILYLLYLRVSELVTSVRWEPTMGDFWQDSQENWWFKTVSKGNKERDITVPDAMLDALKHYRKHRKLATDLPLPNEETTLIHSLSSKKGITNDRQIRKIVQLCFDTAYERMIGEEFTDEAKALQTATVHWLRHTGISDDINKRGRPVSHVRDDAGHSSSATTDRYNDADKNERHRSARYKRIRCG